MTSSIVIRSIKVPGRSGKARIYRRVRDHLVALIAGESDPVAIMATISCELFHAFPHFHWVGFYRLVNPATLKVGPYQGSHGCLSISLDRGVCGKCARERRVQIENDVRRTPHHIACSAETMAEIVLPVFDRDNRLCAVLDIDATVPDCFDDTDVRYLQLFCAMVYAGLSDSDTPR